jgi:tetratricopeptide (TPR) repeat protein
MSHRSNALAYLASSRAMRVGVGLAVAGIVTTSLFAVRRHSQPVPTLADIKGWASVGWWDRAETGMQSYLARHPRDPRALLLAARLAARRDQAQQCVELLDRVPTDSPQDIDTLVEKATLLKQVQALARAEQAWREVLDRCGRQPGLSLYCRTAQAELVSLLSLQRRTAEACQLLWDMFPSHPEKWRLLISLARVKGKAVHPDVAIEQLRGCVERFADDFHARRALARYLADAARWQQAEAEATSCLAERPGDAQTLQILLECHFAAGQSNAVDRLLAEPDLDRHSAVVWRIEAQYRDSVGDHSRAQACFEEAIRLAPFDSTSHLQYAHALIRRGQQQGAEPLLERFRKLQEHEDGIERFLDHTIHMDPREWAAPAPDTCRNMAEHCRGLGRPDEARAWLQEAQRARAGVPVLRNE